MIQPKPMARSGYWHEIKDRTFIDSGSYSQKLSIVESGEFIIEVARKISMSGGRFLNNRAVKLEDILDFLRESPNQLDRDVFEWFLFHIDEFI